MARSSAVAFNVADRLNASFEATLIFDHRDRSDERQDFGKAIKRAHFLSAVDEVVQAEPSLGARRPFRIASLLFRDETP